MILSLYLADAQLLDLSLSFVAEVIAFVIMIAILARFVYPPVIRAAEARQKQVASELAAAEDARKQAEARMADAQKQLDDARANAQEIITGASRSADQLRNELKQKAEEEAARVSERARQEIEAERVKAIGSVRQEVANLVVEATEKVIGESLDATKHRQLIDKAIAEVTKN